MGLRYGLRPYAPLVPGYSHSEYARHFFVKSAPAVWRSHRPEQSRVCVHLLHT